MFNLNAHNCAICPEYNDCELKNTVDIFKDNEPEFVRVAKTLRKLMIRHLSRKSAQEMMEANVDAVMVGLMLIGYSLAKKEDSCKTLEDILKT